MSCHFDKNIYIGNIKVILEGGFIGNVPGTFNNTRLLNWGVVQRWTQLRKPIQMGIAMQTLFRGKLGLISRQMLCFKQERSIVSTSGPTKCPIELFRKKQTDICRELI